MIQVENLHVQVGGFRLAGISFTIPQGQYCVLMGKSGSGKTTLLEAICGLKKISGGTIHFGKRDVTHQRPADRGIGFVPQDGALFSAMTVEEHLQFAMQVRRWPKETIELRIAELSQLLHLEKLLARHPHQLSGGERQRVALGRALSFGPHILCLDEPLSALDDDSRVEMIQLLKHVQQEIGVTALHVTHNRSEAEQLADMHLSITAGQVQPVNYSKPLPQSQFSK